MVIGAAGELPKAPSNPVIFLEDLDDTELARAVRPALFYCSTLHPTLYLTVGIPCRSQKVSCPLLLSICILIVA